MSKELAGHIAIILETIAFFFVTVDLYGKERLIELRNRIQALKIDEENRIFDHPIKRSYGLNVFVHSVVLTPIFIYIYFSIKYGAFLVTYGIKHGAIYFVVYTIFIVGLSFLIVWKIREVLEIFRYVTTEILLFYVVKLLILTTKLFPVEGVMITIGAILFIISRIIAYNSIAA